MYQPISPARKLLTIACAFVFLINSASGFSLLAQTANKGQLAEGQRLKIIEDLSESLANDLLELSVAARDRDYAGISEYFPVRLSAKTFPSHPTSTVNQIKWIGTHKWESVAKPAAAAANQSASHYPILR
ncbi:MAG: hypothetical protein M3209_16305 [Acidobacteriota bacterium]|nr:hypothetical protein [Acidobacteriota bacterium]